MIRSRSHRESRASSVSAILCAAKKPCKYLRYPGFGASLTVCTDDIDYNVAELDTRELEEARANAIGHALSEHPPFTTSAHPCRVLEVGAGNGAQAALRGRRFAHCSWRPTEYSPATAGAVESAESAQRSRDGIIAPTVRDQILKAAADLPNVLEPAELNVGSRPWPDVFTRSDFDAVYVSMLLHIAPWNVTEGLFAGAARALLLLLAAPPPLLLPGVAPSPLSP